VWGTKLFPTGAGSHNVTISFKTYWFIPSNKATTSVTVAEGQTAKVEYETSWFFLLAGKISAA
jgi:hypothetical protein